MPSVKGATGREATASQGTQGLTRILGLLRRSTVR
jgi:hypothetical protein